MTEQGDAYEGERDITADGFTLPPKPVRVTLGDRMTKRPASERELLARLEAMYPENAKAIREAFKEGYLEVQQRRKK